MLKNVGRQEAVSNWFRENPHRLHLGIIGFDLRKANGSIVTLTDIRNSRQTLDLWQGEIRSHFEVDNQPVDVVTLCHPGQDIVAVQVRSPLIAAGRLRVTLRFPYGATTWEGFPDFDKPTRHTTRLWPLTANAVVLDRQLDTTRYTTALAWTGQATVREQRAHEFVLVPAGSATTLAFTCRFASGASPAALVQPTFAASQQANQAHWQSFWTGGGAVDLSGSTDPRAAELERRIVLSQYLTKIQCSGSIPPQETGLTYNSWYGKPHLEMHWWHAVHFMLWNRPALLEKSLGLV